MEYVFFLSNIFLFSLLLVNEEVYSLSLSLSLSLSFLSISEKDFTIFD